MKLSKSSKIIALFLCMTFIILPFFACNSSDKNSQNSGINNNENPKSDDVQSDEENSQTNQQASRLDVSDDLPEMDFGDSAFNILYLTWGTYPDYYWADEEIGEIMNDSLYRRERDTEERFNVQINKIPIEYGQVTTTMGKSVRAGSHDYDMALTHYSNELPALITRNYILDWNKIPYLDFDKPWWSSKNPENQAHRLGFIKSLTPKTKKQIKCIKKTGPLKLKRSCLCCRNKFIHSVQRSILVKKD